MLFSFKFEMDNSNSIGRTSSRSCRVSATTRQNGAVSGRIFFFSRSRLQRGIVCIAQRNACAHHCTADMPMGLKKDEINTHKSTLIYLRKKTKLSPILVYVNLETRPQGPASLTHPPDQSQTIGVKELLNKPIKNNCRHLN